MTTTIRRVTMAALLALSLTACGGGSDDTSDSADTGSEQGAGSSDGADTPGSATGDDSGSDVSGGAAEGDEPDDNTIATIGDLPGVSEECESIANFIGATGQLLGGQLDPVEGRAIIDDFLAAVDDSIRPAAAVLGDYMVSLLQLVNDLGSFEAVLTTPEGMAAIEKINTPEYDEANQAISTYFAENCPLGG